MFQVKANYQIALAYHIFKLRSKINFKEKCNARFSWYDSSVCLFSQYNKVLF